MAEVEVAPRIAIDDAIHPGRPIIKGSRIPVSLVLGSSSAGLSPSEVAREYEVAEEDIRAALDSARAVAEQETVNPFHSPQSLSNPQSAIRNPKSLRNPQSAIRNPKSLR